MTILLVSLMLCNPPTRQDELLRTWKAITWVESKGDPLAVNEAEEAVGIGQIRPIMVRDANRIIGHEKYTLADRWDPIRSYEIFRLVVRYYFPCGTPEQWARCWVGGPKGPQRASSLLYWSKVKAVLDREPSIR